jgi:uncharacterized protein YjbI with pentapeptide repeats
MHAVVNEVGESELDKQPGLQDWLGLRVKPDFTKARPLGALAGALLVLVLGALALGALGALAAFLAAVLHLGPYAEGPTDEAIRNIGLVLAAAFGAPFVAWRSMVAQRQANTAEQGLITDRITKAVAGLGTEKSSKRQRRNTKGKLVYVDGPDGEPDLKQPIFEEVSEPNLEVRIGAIYALERISQDSPRDHVQIMEILCAYIRENAPGSEAEEGPIAEWKRLTENTEAGPGMTPTQVAEAKKNADADRIPDRQTVQRWVATLKPRTDIQVAAQVIGRRTGAQVMRERADTRHGEDGYRLDLRGANLQGVDLSHLDLRKALLHGARMEGANLGGARMEGANLRLARMERANLGEARLEEANFGEARMERTYLSEAWMKGANFGGARMEGAYLSGARMQGANLGAARTEGADLSWVRMEGANLSGARMEGADLSGARFDERTSFDAAVVRSAAMKSVDLTTVSVSQDQVNSLFGDGSVTRPEVIKRPAHWPEADLDWHEFRERWRTWQAETGHDARAKGE